MCLDYQYTGINEGFTFINPNAKAYCGCGVSFTI
jgi:iron-sulfur cluster assembly protein